MTRLVGAPVALGFAVGCWFFPWFSWLTLAVARATLHFEGPYR